MAITYTVSFGSYYQTGILTRGMAEALAQKLIDSNFEGCRDVGMGIQDLINT